MQLRHQVTQSVEYMQYILSESSYLGVLVAKKTFRSGLKLG